MGQPTKRKRIGSASTRSLLVIAGAVALALIAGGAGVLILGRSGHNSTSTLTANSTTAHDESKTAATTLPRSSRQEYLDALTALGVPTRMQQRGYDEQALVDQGQATCDKIRTGASVSQLQMAMAQQYAGQQEQDIQFVKDSGYMLGYAVRYLCPEFKSQLSAP